MEPITAVMVVILAIASIEDLRSYRIPNWVTLPGMAVGFLHFSMTGGYPGFLFSFAGALAGVGILVIPFTGGGMGAGDVKLMGAVGSFLGAQGVLAVFMLSCLLGGLYALVLLSSKNAVRHTFGRYGSMLRCFLTTRKLIYIPPPVMEKRLKIRFGVVIALGTLSYLLGGF